MRPLFDMKLISSDPISLAANLADVPAVEADLERLMTMGSRVGLYGMLVGLLLWAWLVFPALGLPPFPFVEVAGLAGHAISIMCWVLIAVVASTVGHEVLHLLALPNRLARKDTLLVFWRRKPILFSTLFVKIGGDKSKLEFVWISIFPFVVLTLVPFLLAAFSDAKPPLIVGIIAVCNIYSSSVDVLQSIVLAVKAPAGAVIR